MIIWMTSSGGALSGGAIFEWDPATNIYTKKIDFDYSTTGGFPQGSLTLSGGKFYGMTNSGGVNGYGVIFEWDPATNTYTKKYDFSLTNGSSPYGSLTLSGGKFYGLTYSGGTYGKGVIFEWDPATNTYTKKFDFNGTNGSNPNFTTFIWNIRFLIPCDRSDQQRLGHCRQLEHRGNSNLFSQCSYT